MTRPDGKFQGGLSRFEREKLLAGLDGRNGHEVRDPGTLPEADRKKLEEEKAAGEAFLARYPDWKTLTAKAPGRPAAPAPRRTRILAFRKPMAYALAACLALLAAPVILLRLPDAGSGGDDLTLKGGAFFTLRINGGMAEKSKPLYARAGDTLQFILHHDAAVHYALYYRDDGGPWRAYLGQRPSGRERATEGEPVAHSIILEPGWSEERIAAVTAPPDAGGDWMECLETGSGPVPGHCRDLHVESFVLVNAEKRAP